MTRTVPYDMTALAWAVPLSVGVSSIFCRNSRLGTSTFARERWSTVVSFNARTVIPRYRFIRMQASNQVAVMVNGVPGKMAAATAEEVIARGLILADEALTGPAVDNFNFAIGGQTVTLNTPEHHLACLRRMKEKYPNIVVVDYTHPSACNPNVELYAEVGLTFVLGTTGGDVDAMHRAVHRAPGVYAVIAPNMAKQIVAFQATMAMMAKEFPGAFAGYEMTVTESHQSTKADTSGTAKAIVASFQDLGIQFNIDDIEKIRSPPESMEKMKVPGKYVTTGHAFHTYRLSSPDGTVSFEFQHNACGRSVYAAGTVDAVNFIAARMREGAEQRVYNMIDILRSGSMH